MLISLFYFQASKILNFNRVLIKSSVDFQYTDLEYFNVLNAVRAYLLIKKPFLPPLIFTRSRAFGFIFIFLKKKNKGYRRNPLRGMHVDREI
jgi:hypothetical protein